MVLNIKNYFVQNKITLITILIVLFFILIFARVSFLKNKEIEKNGIELIAKFTHYKNYPKSKSYFFEFYYLNKKKVMDRGRAPKGFIYNVGKYYKIKYLPKYPNLFIVDFDKEVTNEEEILKAGFNE